MLSKDIYCPRCGSKCRVVCRIVCKGRELAPEEAHCPKCKKDILKDVKTDEPCEDCVIGACPNPLRLDREEVPAPAPEPVEEPVLQCDPPGSGLEPEPVLDAEEEAAFGAQPVERPMICYTLAVMIESRDFDHPDEVVLMVQNRLRLGTSVKVKVV